MRNPFKLACLLAAALLLGACQKDYTAYALNSSGNIIKFSTRKPTNITGNVTITGLGSGQSVVQMTYRPASTGGSLYCITNDGFLCTVDPDTGAATVVGTIPFIRDLDGDGNDSKTLTGTVVMSFDPVADQLRIINSSYNLRVNPVTGERVKQATAVKFDNTDTNHDQTPALMGLVYKNPVAGTGSTTLYALDSGVDSLLRIGDNDTNTVDSGDGGDLRTIGDTGVSFNQFGGFCIEQKNGDAFAVLQTAGNGAALYSVDLDNGATTNIGAIGDNNQTIQSLVIKPGD